jgi:glucokinase
MEAVIDADCGVVGDIGRKTLAFGLVRRDGRLDLGSIRDYPSSQQSTLSGALSTFSRDAGLPGLPRHCAIAIAGSTRGESLIIPHSRMVVSRSGLRSMLRAEPVIVNECAAAGWALGSGDGTTIQPIVGRPQDPVTTPGTYCLMRLGTGLGVSVIRRTERQGLTVLESEAAHSQFATDMPDVEALLPIIRQRAPRISLETLVSAPGLCALYSAVAQRDGQTPLTLSPEEVTRRASSRTDMAAVQAVEMFARITWAAAGNLTLTYAAWDGIFLSGVLAEVLRSVLTSPTSLAAFYIANPFERVMRQVPLSFARFERAELHGAAHALQRIG